MRTSKTVMAQLGAVDIFTYTYLVTGGAAWLERLGVVPATVDVAYLVTGGAAWLERLGVVTPAVDVVVLVEVDEVDEELLARDADEAGRVPAQVFVHLGRVDGHLAHVDVAVTAVAALKQLLCQVLAPITYAHILSPPTPSLSSGK